MSPVSVITAGVLAAVLALVSTDVVLPPIDPGAEEPRPVPAQTSGAWYCAVGDTRPGTELEFAATAVATRRSGSSIRLEAFSEGRAFGLQDESRVVRGRVQTWSQEAGDADTGTIASWRDGPALLSRTWRRSVVGEPGGPVSGPCEPEPSSTWIAPGVTTIGGAVATLEVANPFDTDAAVSVELLGSGGPESPELLKNIGVPARSVRSIVLNDHAPEREHIAAVLEVRAGRVVAEAWQSVDPAVGGVAGVGLVKLARQPAERWTLPWLAAGDASSWLWVANLGERPAEISITVHADVAADAVEAPDEITVPPRSTAQVAVGDLLGDDLGSGAFTVVSENGEPIVVGGATRISGNDVARTGYAVHLAHASLSPFWAIPVPVGEGRRVVLHVANPTARDARAEVRIASDVGLVTPPDLGSVAVPAGSVVRIDVTEAVAELDDHTVVVEATRGAVVAAAHSYQQDGPLELIVHRAVPSQVWAPTGPLVDVERDPTLTRRIGTATGPATEPDEVDGLDEDDEDQP